jgi:hypothetical protein
MNSIIRIALCSPLLAGSLPACTPSIALDAVASHTIQTGPTQEADVVWIVAKGKFRRCAAFNGVPRCTIVEIDP